MFMIVRNLCWWKRSSFLISRWYMVQVLHPYNSVEMTTAWYTISFVHSVRSLFRNTLWERRPKAIWAARILFSTSFSDVHRAERMLPRYEKWSTCSSDISEMVILKSWKEVPGAGCASTLVFWVLIVRPKRSYAFLKRLTESCSSIGVWAGEALSSAYCNSVTLVMLVSLFERSLAWLKRPPSERYLISTPVILADVIS